MGRGSDGERAERKREKEADKMQKKTNRGRGNETYGQDKVVMGSKKD